MTERTDAVRLANKVLDRVNADPDDDLAILSRQFLRMCEAILRHGRHTNDCRYHGGHDCSCGIEYIRDDLSAIKISQVGRV